MKDYYEILGISKNATDDEIKKAYRKQALKWHPDKNNSQEATERFKEINKAFEVLADSKKKQMYDQYGADAFERGGAAGGWPGGQGPFSYTYTSYGGESVNFEDIFGGFHDPFEIFEQFFGFQTRRSRKPVYETTLEFEEAAFGTEKEAKIDGRNKKIKIPAGVDDGTRIRFSDFDIVVHVKPHKVFKRQGQDIYVEEEIPFKTAVLGGEVEVPLLGGKTTKLKVRLGTESGTMVRLGGQGIAYPHSHTRGDQYVIFKVKIPQRVSFRAKKLLEELEKEL